MAELVEGNGEQIGDIVAGERFVEHFAEHVFQAACISLHTVGNILQHAFVLRAEFGVFGKNGIEFVG